MDADASAQSTQGDGVANISPNLTVEGEREHVRQESVGFEVSQPDCKAKDSLTLTNKADTNVYLADNTYERGDAENKNNPSVTGMDQERDDLTLENEREERKKYMQTTSEAIKYETMQGSITITDEGNRTRQDSLAEEGDVRVRLDSVADGETEQDTEHDDDEGDDHDITEEEEDIKHDSNLTPQQRARHAITGRGVTLSMLMGDGMIEPGEDNMSIEYLGQKFTADLLTDGRIRWREEDKLFGSPSAWAIHCKKIVNPMKKSGCGWASVKYKGKKLNSLKSTWTRKQHPISGLATTSSNGKEDIEDSSENDEPEEKRMKEESDDEASQFGGIKQEHRVSVQHCSLGRKSNLHDPNTLVECTPYSVLNKIQPFNVIVSTNALLLMDFHCHLNENEVLGYLGGKWDSNTQCISVEEAVPCIGKDKEAIETSAKMKLVERGLKLVGWYHSHPRSQPDPSLRDLEAQMEYQIAVGGPLNSFQPCLAFIISPHDSQQQAKGNKESTMRVLWVMPPSEQRAWEYGMPMTMHYELQQEQYLPSDMLTNMTTLVSYYKEDGDLIDFTNPWLQDLSLLDKLKGSLLKKLPTDKQSRGFLASIDKLLRENSYKRESPTPPIECTKVEMGQQMTTQALADE